MVLALPCTLVTEAPGLAVSAGLSSKVAGAPRKVAALRSPFFICTTALSATSLPCARRELTPPDRYQVLSLKSIEGVSACCARTSSGLPPWYRTTSLSSTLSLRYSTSSAAHRHRFPVSHLGQLAWFDESQSPWAALAPCCDAKASNRAKTAALRTALAWLVIFYFCGSGRIRHRPGIVIGGGRPAYRRAGPAPTADSGPSPS